MSSVNPESWRSFILSINVVNNTYCMSDAVAGVGDTKIKTKPVLVLSKFTVY